MSFYNSVFNSKAIALVNTENASNKVAYLGEGLFPAKKKMGLDLRWIKGHKGLPVALKPSAFDTKSTIRSREGFSITETEMAFFKESRLLKERDRQDLLQVKESTDPYAQDVLRRLFDDSQDLIDGAMVVPEIMRMQLLTPSDGHPKISLQADGATYAYNYDPDGKYAENNFAELTLTDKWDNVETSDPLADVQEAKETVEEATGTTIEYMIVSPNTMKLLKQNERIKSAILAQNRTANVFMTEGLVKDLFATTLGITIIVYKKQYKDSVTGETKKFFEDGFATLIPSGDLGNTWFGTTPEEADLISKADVDVSIVNTGVAVSVLTHKNPVQIETLVSEIVLPSYERMAETYVIKAY